MRNEDLLEAFSRSANSPHNHWSAVASRRVILDRIEGSAPEVDYFP